MTGNRTAPGFTVIEMMVAITIFSTIAVIMAQTFVSYNQIHRRVAYSSVLGQEARFLNELMVREARNKTLDYVTGDMLAQDTELRLQAADGSRVRIALQTAASGNCGSNPNDCVAYSNDDGGTWNVLTGKNILVKQFEVFARPAADPFSSVTPANTQPFVTVALTLQYQSDNPAERPSLQTQTTVTSRIYRR